LVKSLEAVRGAMPFLLRPSPAEAGYGPRRQVGAEGVAQDVDLCGPAALIFLRDAGRGEGRTEWRKGQH